jgi:transposase-like protein
MGKKVGPRDVAEMVRLSEEGYKPKQIADELDWNVNTVRHWLKKYAESEGSGATEDSAPTPDPGSSDGGSDDPGSGETSDSSPTLIVSPPTPSDVLAPEGDVVRDIADFLNENMESIGLEEKKRKFCVNAVRSTPQYQSPDGMFHFLLNAGVNAQKTKLLIEMVFGAFQQYQSGQQQPYGSPMMPGPMAPGMGPMGPRMPPMQGPNMPPYQNPMVPPQQPQWDPRVGQWVQPQPQYPNPQQGNGALTQADIDRKIAEARAEDERQRALEDRFDQMTDQINRLGNAVANSGGSGGGEYIEEIVPMLGPDGKPMYDDDDKMLMKKVTRPASHNSPEMALAQTMFQQSMEIMRENATSQSAGPDPETERVKEENRKLAADLKEQKLREDMAAQNAALREQLAASQAATNENLKNIAANIGLPQGSSDEVTIGLKKIDSQTEIIKQGAGQVHETVKEGINLVKELIKTPPPAGKDKVEQWTDDDLDYINS